MNEIMQESKSTDKKGTSQLIIYLLIGIIIVVVFKVNDPFHIIFLSLAVIAYTTYKGEKYIKLSIVDISLLLLILYELIVVNFSINKIASAPNLVRLSQSLLFYNIIRALTIDKIEKLFNGLALFIISILILSLTSFYLYISELNKVDFGHYLNDMKFLYRPLGFLANTWTSYLILFLGAILIYICIFKQNSKIILFYSIIVSLLIFNIIVTFSRGAYVALAFIMLGTYICVLKKKNKE